jgi:hypothetical protein
MRTASPKGKAVLSGVKILKRARSVLRSKIADPLKEFSRDKLISPKDVGHSFRPTPFDEPAWSDPKSFWKFKKTFLEKVSFPCFYLFTLENH